MEIFGPVLDVRPLFGQERRELLGLLRQLAPGDWSTATVCPGWDVHDIAGHVLNDYVRRLSGSRDGYAGAVFADDETLPTYLARTNDEFVRATRQCSPELMIELLEFLGPRLDRTWATFDLLAPAPLNVTWAGPGPTPLWLDVAREYTEFWVHQQQIRDAVGRPGADQPELLRPVVDTFMRALPHTLRECVPAEGTVAAFTIPGSGTWCAVFDQGRWGMGGSSGSAAATVTLAAGDFWRLASRGISVAEARERAETTGDPVLVEAMTTLVAVIR